MTIYFADGTDIATAPSSAVKQVVRMSTNTATSASGGFSHRSQYDISITPTSSSNKIVLYYSVPTGINGSWYGAGYLVYRNSTRLYASGTGSRGIVAAPLGVAYDHNTVMSMATWIVEDSPATTSSITYKLYSGDNEGDSNTGIYINRTGDDANNGEHLRSYTTVIAMEVT